MSDKQCRRCSDCGSQDHHWIEYAVDPEFDDANDTFVPIKDIIKDWKKWLVEDPENAPIMPVVWVCKHCPTWKRHSDCSMCDGTGLVEVNVPSFMHSFIDTAFEQLFGSTSLMECNLCGGSGDMEFPRDEPHPRLEV